MALAIAPSRSEMNSSRSMFLSRQMESMCRRSSVFISNPSFVQASGVALAKILNQARNGRAFGSQKSAGANFGMRLPDRLSAGGPDGLPNYIGVAARRPDGPAERQRGRERGGVARDFHRFAGLPLIICRARAALHRKELARVALYRRAVHRNQGQRVR